MPSKDLSPSLHQMIAAAFLKNHVPLDRYQMAEHFQPAINLTKAGRTEVSAAPDTCHVLCRYQLRCNDSPLAG